MKQHLGPGRFKDQNTDGEEHKIAERGAYSGHERQASGHNDVEQEPGELQQIGGAAAETVGVG